MFSIHIFLFNGQSYILPIPYNFLPSFVEMDGIITQEGLTFLSKQFYFLNQICSGKVKCDDFKSFFELFAHKKSIRDVISIKTIFSSYELKDCSKIFNHTHIGDKNFLTPEGIELIFGSNKFEFAWIYINNYNVIFNECYNSDYNTEPTTPNKKHKAHDELVCPCAPKKKSKK